MTKAMRRSIVQRERNQLVIYVPLDHKASAAWVDIFESFAGAGDQGFAFAAGNMFPRFSGGPAATASLDLTGVGGKGVGDRIKGALAKLKELIELTDSEDRRRTALVTAMAKVADNWWTEVPPPVTHDSL